MPATKKTYGFLKLLILAALFVVLNPGIMAQVSGSANIRAAIVSSDELSDLSLISADGTEFLLQNDMNRCFDVTITGLSPRLGGEVQKNDFNYELSPRKIQPTSFCNSNTRIKVLFCKSTNSTNSTSSIPYSISINYN